MQQLNRYYRRSKISERKMRQIIKYFALDLTASKTAEVVAVTRPSVSRIFVKIRRRIAEEAERASPFGGTVEVDESYFGAKRVRGRRGRGASGKTIVFGIFKRSGSVYTEVVPDCKARTLQAIIRGHVAPESVIHSDGWRGYDGLVDVGYKKHFRVNHSDNQFAIGTNHINGIESFWSLAKRRLQKFNGVSKKTFYLHLKECEYRFNNRKENFFRLLLKLLENNPL
ncbi:MAG: IS1595 family transposase [Acidobacteria bacterium]|jgi:transposase-like protein|nr:IS1595 family transposase [Acidobacteriota bacterium]